MNTKDTGGPAFPLQGSCGTVWEHNGMTLRDWFAGQALAGIVSMQGICWEDEPNGAAAVAYKISDMMISERTKQ